MSSDGRILDKIVKEPLRAVIRRQLIDSLFQGRLEPGERLNERDLTRQLGISRTPLREALIGLEYEGLVEPRSSKGFQVATLRADTARQLCALVSVLEVGALEDMGALEEEVLDELDELTRRRAEAGSPGEIIQRDGEWHRKLVGGSDNDELLELAELVRTRLYFYEYAYLRRVGDIEDSIQQHLAVTRHLRRGELEEAIEALKDHWKTGLRTIGLWLDDADG